MAMTRTLQGRALELCEAYEMLRANARQEQTTTAARGFGVFVRSGMAAWMATWTALSPPRHRSPRPDVTRVCARADMGSVAMILVEMALGQPRRE